MSLAVLAIDQGTTSTRGLVMAAGEAPRLVFARQHKQIYPQPQWVEHDPEELLRDILSCVEAAGAEIEAIGIDNQGESCLAWDTETKQAICPLLVWQDSRSVAAVENLKAEGAEPEVLQRAGLPLDPYFSASKLAWIVKELPEAQRLAEAGRLRLGTSDAFFLDRLTGRFVTDVTTASRTSLMNLASRQWDPELCRLFGVPLSALPEIVPTTGDFGVVSVAGQRLPVTASLVDQQAALYGHGCRAAGDAKITFGTGAFALMVTGGEILQAPERGLLPTVAWQKAGESPVYALDGGVYSASAAVNWASDLGLFADFAEIDGFEGPSALERGLTFVPALAGLACPHWDRRARGTWLGLALDTTRQDMMRALWEGVALRAAEVLASMDELLPLKSALSVDGGMSANGSFLDFLAAILNRSLRVPSGGELTAFGCAGLAAEAAGLEITIPDEAVERRPGRDLRALLPRFRQAVELTRTWAAGKAIDPAAPIH